MTPQDAKNALRNAKPLLLVVNNLVSAVDYAVEIEKEVKALEVRKVDAEKGYQQAEVERVQTISATENLKQQYAKLSADLPAAYSVEREKSDRAVADMLADAEKQIVAMHESVKKAESNSAQRISRAEVAAAEAEARVKKAEAALEALKRA